MVFLLSGTFPGSSTAYRESFAECVTRQPATALNEVGSGTGGEEPGRSRAPRRPAVRPGLPAGLPGRTPFVRILVTGWFSFDPAEVTAGDLLARDTAVRWLTEAGLPHDVAVSANFRRPRDLALHDAHPGDYTDVVFVCGPAAGQPVEEMFGRFPHARRMALDVSVVDGTRRLPLDVIMERDRDGAARPDLSLAAPPAGRRIPVIGVVLAHSQPEYGDHRLEQAHALLAEALAPLDAARVLIETRVHPCDPWLCRTPAQVEAALARCDAVAASRMHGLVLALKAGVPAVGVDPVAGGGKVSRQAEALGWPGVARVGETSPQELSGLLRWCLTAEARTMAARITDRAVPALDDIRARFLALFRPCP